MHLILASTYISYIHHTLNSMNIKKITITLVCGSTGVKSFSQYKIGISNFFHITLVLEDKGVG